MNDTMVIQARRIAGEFLLEQVKSSYPIIGKGFVNQVCVVETEGHKVVVRMNNKDNYPTFIKEKWCIEQAAAGIPGPYTWSVGVMDETAYMIQTFVEGDNGLDSKAAPSDIWRKLGEYAKQIHSIQVTGFGEELIDPIQGTFRSPPHPGSDGSWRGYVHYNINSLTEHDPLLELGVIKKKESGIVRQWFEQLSNKKFRFGLCHGDISLKNTMVHPTGQLILLDWGSAEVTVVPYGDVIHLMRCQLRGEGPDEEQLKAFSEGYGMSEEELDLARHVLLLKAFDNLRWAMDKCPEQVNHYAGSAKQVFNMVRDASRD
ncbi:phosphotransferase [Paenibacillus sp. JNUCC31]|uniref:phosphotransferase family protein n=1 Tax=Paenibacillus sp. JNUCC-31 TaxID=2777983 RepID=UPI00177E5352|nr:phosphotransferase [Paenibacillus sp. JNUCC-31]QOS80922.1 phosphotransferase [Paenibacillus sp. JNUCC-31]